MVSGFVTSPCDQLRIFSGEARLMRIASKSAIGFARSNGLERNKVSSTLAAFSLPPAAPTLVVSGSWPVTSLRVRSIPSQLFLKILYVFLCALCVLCGEGLENLSQRF